MRYWERIKVTISENTSKFDQKWKTIASMNLSRKNTSAWSATKDLIYVFGGGNSKMIASDTIEQYTISKNKWHLLNVMLPKWVGFSISQRISNEKILIIGGWEVEKGILRKQTSNVFMFNFSGHKSAT